MASILHVTDKEMIEFHRLNGNNQFNFWRPSSSKKFTDFKKGDYVFFLAKGSERKREKGIIGYGKCTSISLCSFDYMWKKYGTRNGYHTKKDCYEAIVKVVKDHEMPKRLNCIELDDVVFFSAPVYLSEFGVKISNKLESYTYLDKENLFLSSKVILKANKYGLDVWTSSLSEAENRRKLAIDALILFCANIYSMMQITTQRQNIIYSKQYCAIHDSCITILNADDDFIELKSNYTYINIPITLNEGDIYSKLQNGLGKLLIYEGFLKNLKIDHLPSPRVQLIFNQELTVDCMQLLENLKCPYKISAIE